MGFDALSRDLTASVFDALGDEAVFTPAGGDPIALRAQLNPATTVVGELGHYADPRPSIALPGHALPRPRPRAGRLVMLGRTWTLDQLTEAGADDEHVVRYYVREITGGGTP